MTTGPADRTELIERVRADLDGGTRGVALWGPPGVGKSWLAERVAPNATRIDAELLADLAAIDQALASGGSSVIVDELDGWCDRDADGIASLLARWLDEGDRRIVTTHRRRWTPRFARAVAVAPLDPESAMAMFVSEMERLHSPSRLDEAGQAAVREVLPALDGLPRAILWAASRWGVFGTDGLVERLRGTVPKALLRDHEALVAALDDEVRAAIEAMTIFAGDFTADDAETVLGDALNVDVVEALTDLHDRTLLHRTAPGTFRVPRLVRQVVPADPSSPLAERHVAWCLQRSETERWRPPEPEVPDVVQAVQWLIDQGDARVGSLLVNLASSPSPGRYLELAEQARQHAPSPDVHRAHARILRLRGRFSEAAETLREGLALAGSDCRAAGPLWRHWGVLHHTTGDWEAAREGHEQALACARELSDVHGIALATANLGTIDHDRCAYEDAEQHYAEAMQGLRAVDDPHVELTVRVNQAVLWQELGKLDAAEPAYRQALVLLERTGNARTTAITLGNLGLLLHEQGRLDEAEPCLRDAFERVGSIEDPKSEALCLARLAAVHADQGRVEPADRAWESATWTVQQADDVSAKVVDLFGAFVDLAHGREPVARARLDSSEAVLQLSGDARIAARMLRRRLSAAPASLQIDETGFVPPGGERVDLSRHASIRRMFQALVQTARQPGQSLDVAALFAAGWPDERIGPDSMRNRVHVNLAKLRRWGLKTLIERTEDGYRLQATVVGG